MRARIRIPIAPRSPRLRELLRATSRSGRNFDEVLRLLDSIQLTAKYKVATPVNWKHGEDVIIVPSVSDEEAKKRFPKGWKSPKPYMRIVSEGSAAYRFHNARPVHPARRG
jgi:hypothetical protein